MKVLQKHMGGIVQMLKDLKVRVGVLENKSKDKEIEEIKEILEAQAVIDEILVANSDAIKRIDKEIKSFVADKVSAHEPNNAEQTNPSRESERKSTKKCKFYNAGFCKYKLKKCRFLHPESICKEYLKNMKCELKDCVDRHPKICKWLKTKLGCQRGEEFDYLHVTLANDDREISEHKHCSESRKYNCIGCKSCFTDKDCVIKHTIQNRETYFCLNCEDWVKEKFRVYDRNWSLLDQDGYLRMDI